MHEREDDKEEDDDTPQVEAPVHAQETLLHDAEDLIKHQQQETRGEGECAGEQRGDQGVDLVVRSFAEVMLQELFSSFWLFFFWVWEASTSTVVV